jgi:hypothetical protein
VKRRTEALLVGFASLIAAGGTAIVTATTRGTIGLDMAAAGVAHLAAFGGC